MYVGTSYFHPLETAGGVIFSKSCASVVLIPTKYLWMSKERLDCLLAEVSKGKLTSLI